MPTEFLHGLYDGGLGAGLEDYWKALYASPMGAGGFLWALVDEGVVRTDREGQLDVAANQAPDGIVGPYRQKEASFYTIRKIWSPIQTHVEHLTTAFDGRLWFENRYDFTNLKDCRFELTQATFPAPGDKTTGHSISSRRTFRGPDVAPHERGALPLDLFSSASKDEVLYLTAYDPRGRELWTWSLDLQGNDRYIDRYVIRQSAQAVALRKTGQEICVTVGDLALVFDGGNGVLSQVTRAGHRIDFGNGPRLIGGEGRARETSTSRNENSGSVQVHTKYDGAMRRAMWTIYPTGWISLDYEYELHGQFDIFGISFDYPESKMQAMRFLGRGPYRVWKNRLQGGTFDVWSNKHKNDIPGVTWDFPEFKGYYQDWRWVVFSTEQGDITIVNGKWELFLGVYRPNDGPFPANTKLNVPETGIALLHGIPAIGTKFDKPEVLGPQSQKNHASGTYRGTVWFHFGD